GPESRPPIAHRSRPTPAQPPPDRNNRFVAACGRPLFRFLDISGGEFDKSGRPWQGRSCSRPARGRARNRRQRFMTTRAWHVSVPAPAGTKAHDGPSKCKTGARLAAGPRLYCARPLLLLTGAGSLGRPEGNPSPHGLLLNCRRGTPELLRDLAGRRSRFRERLQGLQLTGAPGRAIVRGTFRHYSILRKTPNCRVGAESYTLLRKKARPT